MPSRLTALLLAAVFAVTARAEGQQPSQPKLLVRDALLFTMAPDQRKPFIGYFTVAPDGTILTVAPGNPPATLHAQQTLDAHGHWIIPGFISAHSHLWQAAFRGLAADSTLTGWLTAVYNDSGNKSRPEDLYWFTLDGALDHLQHGITAVYSFDYGGDSVCSPVPADIAHTCNGYTFRAEMDSGIRFVHGYDVGKATAPGIAPAYTAAQARIPLKAFLDYAQQASTKANTQQYLSTMISGYAAFSNTESQAYLDKALMQEFHLHNQSHYLEPPESAQEEQAKFHWFTDSGLLGPDLIRFGPVSDPYASLVFVTSEPDLESVYVGGTLRVDHSHLINQNISKVDTEVNQRVARIRAKQ